MPRAAASREDVLGERPAQGAVHLEAERGQLDGDVRVEPVALDRSERVVVGLGDRLGLLRLRDLLPEHVDRRPHALGVHPGDDTARVLERLPRDVGRRDPAHHRPWHRRQHPDDRAIEEPHAVAPRGRTGLGPIDP